MAKLSSGHSSGVRSAKSSAAKSVGKKVKGAAPKIKPSLKKVSGTKRPSSKMSTAQGKAPKGSGVGGMY